MDAPSDTHKPGDIILNRYMPDATQEQREEARENLHELARVLLRVEARLLREYREREIRTAEEGTVHLDGQSTPPV